MCEPGLEVRLAVDCGAVFAGCALVHVCHRVHRVGESMLEGVAGGLDASELEGEGGFALGQAFDVGGGRLVVVTYLVEGDFGGAQSLRELVAVGHRLRQLAVEACLALREVAGRGRQCRFVSLFRIAQGGVRVCDRVPCLGQLQIEGVAGGLDVGELGGEGGFALRQTFDVGSSRL